MKYYIAALKKYAVVSGRARRREYWGFVFGNMILAVILSLIAVGIRVPFLVVIFDLAIIIPSVTVGVRRMHDVDRSGWWILAPIANLIFALVPGTAGSNRYGADPKGGTRVPQYNEPDVPAAAANIPSLSGKAARPASMSAPSNHLP